MQPGRRVSGLLARPTMIVSRSAPRAASAGAACLNQANYRITVVSRMAVILSFPLSPLAGQFPVHYSPLAAVTMGSKGAGPALGGPPISPREPECICDHAGQDTT